MNIIMVENTKQFPTCPVHGYLLDKICPNVEAAAAKFENFYGYPPAHGWIYGEKFVYFEVERKAKK